MSLTGDDLKMAVRDFFDPSSLLEFLDLPDREARATWGARQFASSNRGRSVRRLAGEPDAGRKTHWTAADDGFIYEVEATDGGRRGPVTWHVALQVAGARLTPVRYGALRKAVEAVAAHDAAYVPSPVPFRTVKAWEATFYRPWAKRASALELLASSAFDVILPAAVAQPSLF
ncbi:hypothetical protein OG453_07040 [Streptomyces sp. NBC_01381]|uniref:hypothetical protein n=1 Tax=Streptomyces sp. NBC_01381 TaxID=2903845 RepID=UPI0022596B33|nr:hypothetical protein [Streptomyces sp. NBC_01381]MCX4666423.1 hypothetical protein [Streptomyces sp. NBC_01381]